MQTKAWAIIIKVSTGEPIKKRLLDGRKRLSIGKHKVYTKSHKQIH